MNARSGRRLGGTLAALVAATALLALPALAGAKTAAYVSNEDGNAISQYKVFASGDLNDLSPATVDAPGGPYDVMTSVDGSSVYASALAGASVLQYDVGERGALSAKSPSSIAAGNGPTGIAGTPDGSSVYVTNVDDATISQYDVGAGGALTPKATPTVTGGVLAFPIAIAVSPDGLSAYVANLLGDSISQFDIADDGSLTPKDPPTVTSDPGAIALAVSPDGLSVYSANAGTDAVDQYDVGTGGLLSPKSTPSVAAGSDPGGIAISPDGASVYAANQEGRTVSQYDVGSGGLLSPKSPAEVRAGRGASGIAVRDNGSVPRGNNVYVANSKHAPIIGFDSVSQFGIASGGGLVPRPSPLVATAAGPGDVALLPEVQLEVGAPSKAKPNKVELEVLCGLAPCDVRVIGRARIPNDLSGKARSAGPKTKRFGLKTKQLSLGVEEVGATKVRFKHHRRAVRKMRRILKRTARASRAKLIMRVRATGPGNFRTNAKAKVRLKP